ncbi:ABC transporter substrate-binding protein [Conexibacter sp. S30A1]|uniref:ABC transporter substrate-binding protein n=1 Tax=Conexibacter sp. S30A1 TaxID=2937800 RepID=UPI00200BE06A|nr:ABC transporter substrate-binding protein [Conexibacter sp. S30A1]
MRGIIPHGAKLGTATAGLAAVLAVAVLLIVSPWGTASGARTKAVASTARGGTNYGVATIIPLSGAGAPYGKLFQQAFNLAFTNINKDHIFNGKLINYYYDSQALPAPAVSAAQQAISIHHISAIQIGFTAPVTAVEPLATRDHVLEINVGASGSNLYGLSHYLLSTVPLGNQQVDLFAPWVIKHEHLTRWVVVYTSEPLGDGLKAALDQVVPKSRGKVVANLSVSPTASDYTSLVTQIKSAIGSHQSSTMVYLAVSGQVSGNMQEIINALVAQGVHVKYGGFADSVTPALQSDPNATTYQYTNPTVNLSTGDRSLTRQFLHTWKTTYRKAAFNPGTVDQYDSTLLIADGIHRLQAQHKAVNGTTLIAALQSMGKIPVVGGVWTLSRKGTVNVPESINELTKTGSKVLAR